MVSAGFDRLLYVIRFVSEDTRCDGCLSRIFCSRSSSSRRIPSRFYCRNSSCVCWPFSRYFKVLFAGISLAAYCLDMPVRFASPRLAPLTRKED